MPESVKQEILDEGARRAWNTSYRNLRLAGWAGLAAMLVLTVGNLVAWKFVFDAQTSECLNRQDRIEGQRRVWNAVFDEIERQNPNADEGLDKLQDVVDKELPPLTC